MKQWLMVVLILVSVPAMAERTALKSGHDPRIRTVAYNPLDVVAITAYFGIGTTIQFDPSEQLVGDPVMGITGAWSVVPMDHGRVTLKPTVEGGHTNLTIFTNKRTYNFELKASVQGRRGVDDPNLTYMLFFSYPEDSNKHAYDKYFQDLERKKQEAAQQCDIGQNGLVDPTALNYNYEFSGNRKIAPIVAFDDGQFIYLQFHKNSPIPSAFGVDRNNNETALNTRMKGRDYLVIEQLANRLTLRHGNDVVTIVKNDKQRVSDPEVMATRKEDERGAYDGW